LQALFLFARQALAVRYSDASLSAVAFDHLVLAAFLALLALLT
jgi:hypothetical protein